MATNVITNYNCDKTFLQRRLQQWTSAQNRNNVYKMRRAENWRKCVLFEIFRDYSLKKLFWGVLMADTPSTTLSGSPAETIQPPHTYHKTPHRTATNFIFTALTCILTIIYFLVVAKRLRTTFIRFRN